MPATTPAGAFARASETDLITLAHNLDTAEPVRDCAGLRDHAAAFDRFAAPRKGERF